MGLAVFAPSRMPRSASADMFGGLGAASQQKLHLPPTEPWLPADRLHREFQVVGLLPLGASARRSTRRRSKKMRVQSWAEFSGRREAGRDGRPPCRHRHLQAGAQDAHRQQDGRGEVSPTQSGQFEAVLFSEGLAQYRDHAGARRVRWSSPSRPRTGPKASTCASRRCSRWRIMASQVQKSLRIYLRDPGPDEHAGRRSLA